MLPLDPLAVAMITADTLSSPMHTGAVLVLSQPAGADPGYVDAIHARAISGNESIDPRLRRFPHRGRDTAGIWCWREADSLDLGHHCERRTASSGGLWPLIGELAAERLDPTRPLWKSYLIDGFEAGRFAFYIKVHHATIDGVAGMRMITHALSPEPESRSMPQFYADQRRDVAGPAPGAGSAAHVTSPARWLVRTAARGVGLLERVLTAEVSALADSLVGNTAAVPFGAPYTRFNGGLGTQRTVCAGSWARERIRAVQRAAGVTANDVVTAVIAGVLRTWLAARDELPRRSLVAICPITVRPHIETTPNDLQGNMFGLWLCPLGTDVRNPVERLHVIHRSMSAGKRWVADQGPAASLLTTSGSVAATVGCAALPFGPKTRTGYNVPVSHVPGPTAEMYFNGAHVDEIYPVSTVYDGQALNVTTCSYADRIGFGYVAGADVVPDIQAFLPLTEKSLAELERGVGIRI